MDATHFWELNGKTIFSVVDYAIGSELFSEKMTSYNTMKNTCLSAFQAKRYHVPIKFNFNLSTNTSKNHVDTAKYSSFLYKKANWNKFEEEIESSIESLKDLSSCSVDELTEKIQTIIKQAANNSIPKNSLNRKHKMEISSETLAKIRLKNWWQRQYEKTGSKQMMKICTS